MRLLKTLSRKEKLFVLRKRAGVTQKQFAKKYNIKQPQVSIWETRKGHPIPISVLPQNVLTVDKLTPQEELVLARKRAGLGVHLAAHLMGISRMQLWKAEKGRLDDSKLEPFFEFYRKRLKEEKL